MTAPFKFGFTTKEIYLPVVAFKSRSSDLRALLKVFKRQFDDVTLLKRYEPALRRALYLNTSPQDLSWRAEAFHQLALMYQSAGQLENALAHYRHSLEVFKEYECLGMARTMRDYGLLIATYHDPQEGYDWVKKAFALHDNDLNNAKGQRQRKLTESYLWRTRLLIDCGDREACEALIRFATDTSRDCSLRDQQQAITFVLPYATGLQRQLLMARLVEIKAKRRKLPGAIESMAQLVIGTEIFLARKLISSVLRKE